MSFPHSLTYHLFVSSLLVTRVVCTRGWGNKQDKQGSCFTAFLFLLLLITNNNKRLLVPAVSTGSIFCSLLHPQGPAQCRAHGRPWCLCVHRGELLCCWFSATPLHLGIGQSLPSHPASSRRLRRRGRGQPLNAPSPKAANPNPVWFYPSAVQ